MSNFLSLRNFSIRPTKLNKAIALLTVSDMLTWGPHMVVLSITGIYLASRIGEDVVQIVGIGTAVYTASRGLLQLPIGRLLDHWKLDNDEIVVLTAGNLLMGISYLMYPLIHSADVYYGLQFIFAVGAAMNLVAWKKLFAQNLDRNSEGLAYGEYGFVMGISSAVFGILAGTIANLSPEHFNIAIVSLGFITMLGSIFSALIFMVKKRKSNFWQEHIMGES